MKRFDLGMSINYCPLWGVVESIRELFQNAYDAQTANPENKMYFNYDEDTETLCIGNKNGSLETKTLLLGQTTKAGNDNMIGQHGEGYKVATVVLKRNGKSVKVYNRSEREIWTAKVIKSRRYQADVVVFDIEKVSVFKSVPDHDLIFEVGGITKDEYNAIVASNLHLQSLNSENVIQAGGSRILTDEAHAGRLYVGGLYVTTSRYAKLGYDFEPSLIKLDRDRSFIDGLDLQFICGKVLCATGNINIIKKYKDVWDGEYIRWYLDDGAFSKNNLVDLYDSEYTKFIKKNGKDAIACTSTTEFNQLKRNGFNAVLVNNNQYHFITNSSLYVNNSDVYLKSDSDLADELESWFNENIFEGTDAYNSGKSIIDSVLEALRK